MKFLVLGGGISGLSAAWYLQKSHPHAEITILEKNGRLGGWMETSHSLFERGPRTFVVSRSQSLLQLIEELDLKEEILFSDPSASKKRFLWHQKSLRSISSFWPLILRSLFCELFVPQQLHEDESIYDYAIRRFNPSLADLLLDPMVLGIYAGDIRKLSLRSCFPFLYDLEKKNHSVFRSLFQGKKDSRLFSLKRGMGSLIERLEERFSGNIVLNCPVEAITKEGVFAGKKFCEADKVICALPGHVMGRLTGLWSDFRAKSLWVVNIGFKGHVLKKKGFGYLVPTGTEESLLGMIWDSEIFPRKEGEYGSVLTAMVRDIKNPKAEVVACLKRHLGISEVPDFLEAVFAKEAIPQFEVGFAKRLAQVQKDLKERFPTLSLVGNYIDGVSVDACVRVAKNFA